MQFFCVCGMLGSIVNITELAVKQGLFNPSLFLKVGAGNYLQMLKRADHQNPIIA